MSKPDAFTTMSKLETVLLKQRGLTHLLSRAIHPDSSGRFDPPSELAVVGVHALADSVSDEVSLLFHHAWEAQDFRDNQASEGGGAAA